MEYVYHQLGDALANVVVAAVLLLAARLLGLFRWLKIKAKPSAPISETNANTREQKEILCRLLGELGATRCYLAKIHNGDHYVDGSEILRCSRAIEVARPGISYEAERFKNILISTVLEEQDCIEEEGPGWFVTSKLPLSGFRHINEQTGTRAGARAAVKKAGEIVGFVGADFDHEAKPQSLERIVEYARWLERTL